MNNRCCSTYKKKVVVAVKTTLFILVRSVILYKILIDKIVAPVIMIHLFNYQTRVHIFILLHNELPEAFQLH